MTKERRTVHFQNVPLEFAIKKLLRSDSGQPLPYHHYSYKKIEDVYHIQGPIISLKIDNATPMTVIETLFSQTDTSYAISLAGINMKSISANYTNLPLEEILQRVIIQFDVNNAVVSRNSDGIFVISTKYKAKTPESRGEISFNFDNVDTKEALKVLFSLFNLNYVIDLPISKSITLKKSSIAFNESLASVLRGLKPPFTIAAEDGVFYTILLNPDHDL